MQPTSSSPSSPSFWSAAIREPLLHFVLLGGLIFGAEHVIRSRRADPREIVVGPEVDREDRALFVNAQGREPTDAELKILRERWIDNEVLYREGLTLRLDQGDSTLRDRIIFKALNVIEANLRLPTGDEATLRAWFESHRDRYDTPARFDFSEALPNGSDEATIRRFADALNDGTQLDVQSGVRIFHGRPRNNVVDGFGPEFASSLEQLPLQKWHVVPAKGELRIIRIESREAGTSANFDDLSNDVLQDWRDAKASEIRTAAVRELGKKYTVRIAGSSS